MNLVEVILSVFLFPGFIFTSNIGLFFAWVNRKILARLQWRVGPPIYQPWVDILKLLSKQTIIPSTAHKAAFILAPMIGFTATFVVPLMLPIVYSAPVFSFLGDLIVLVYLLALPGIALMVGGSASGNPYGSVGSSREMMLLLSYELPFIIAIFTVVAKVGGLSITGVVEHQIESGTCLFFTASGFLAFIAAFASSLAKLSLNPFEIPDAKTEIVAGPYTEYSGGLLAIFKLTHAMLLCILTWTLVTLFFGGLVVDFTSQVTVVASSVLCVVKLVGLLFVVSIVHGINPRARIDQTLKFFWLYLTAIACGGLIMVFLGW